jgi:hypothetical protein
LPNPFIASFSNSASYAPVVQRYQSAHRTI